MSEKVTWYDAKRWKEKRKHILLRDKWIDQYLLRQGVKVEANTVHHILPREEYPQYAMADWNLISVSENTHKKILHQKYTGKLTKVGRLLMQETAYRNGVKLKMRTLVIGLPASGKSTWTKKNLGGGIAYEMDSIACAFRLTTPHKEEPHAGARRMAAALRRGWLQAAEQFSDNIFIVRTAPDIAELVETNPDRIIYCRKQWKERPYKYDKEKYLAQIEEALDWAEKNGVPVEVYPPT